MLRIPPFPLICFAVFLFCIPVGKELAPRENRAATPQRSNPEPTPAKRPDTGSLTLALHAVSAADTTSDRAADAARSNVDRTLH